MKIDSNKINDLCLPYMQKPKRILGAKAIVLENIQNRSGQIIEQGEIVEIFQSYQGYGIRTTNEKGPKIYIKRVPHYDIRFLKG